MGGGGGRKNKGSVCVCSHITLGQASATDMGCISMGNGGGGGNN